MREISTRDEIHKRKKREKEVREFKRRFLQEISENLTEGGQGLREAMKKNLERRNPLEKQEKDFELSAKEARKKIKEQNPILSEGAKRLQGRFKKVKEQRAQKKEGSSGKNE